MPQSSSNCGSGNRGDRGDKNETVMRYHKEMSGSLIAYGHLPNMGVFDGRNTPNGIRP